MDFDRFSKKPIFYAHLPKILEICGIVRNKQQQNRLYPTECQEKWIEENNSEIQSFI